MSSVEGGAPHLGNTGGDATSVTAVIQQRPRPDAVAAYEAWIERIIAMAPRIAGHRGVSIIRPHGASDAYTIVLHFDTAENLAGWMGSETRAGLVAQIRPLLAAEESVEIKTGLEFWFTPPAGARAAAPYKQFLVTLSAIFPLSVAVPWALQPAFAAVPWLAVPVVSHFVVAATVVALMTYVIMPRAVRLLASWLYRAR